MVWRNESAGQWVFHKRAIKWLMWGGFWSIFSGLLFAYLSFPLSFLFDKGFSVDNFSRVWSFISFSIFNPLSIFSSYIKWFKMLFAGDINSVHMFLPVFPPFVSIAIFVYAWETNPYEFGPIPYGNAKLAVKRDIDNMGLFKGFMIVLGSFKGKLLKLPDTMSVLCVAAPGTGKTTGVVLPTIFESDDICLFINDGKGEIEPLTSGYRASLGPVFMFNWGMVDSPKEGLFWPKWNSLSPGNIPPPCPGRENYIGGLAYFLIPDGPVGTDPYWIKMARASMEGITHYLVNKCEQAAANDYFLGRLYEGELDDDDYKVLESYYLAMKADEAKDALKLIRSKAVNIDNYVPIGTWGGIPKGWQGMEPSFPMLIDWITEQQMRANAQSKALAEGGDFKALNMDIMREIIMAALEESVHFGYSRRIIMDLNQLADVPKKQRGSIISTAIAGLSLFKNSAVRERTSASDFYTEFMRGAKNPATGQWEPLTVYISIPSGDAMGLAPLTSLFLEMNSGYFIIFKPGEGGAGPYPALYILDEFGMMPNMGSVVDGVGIGLGKKISYLIIVHDFSQISGKYGGDALEIIISNTASKILMRQNNEITANRLALMTEYRTIWLKSKSTTEFMGTNSNPFSYGASYSAGMETIIGASTLLNLPSSKQVVLFQKFAMAPILADQPRYYLDREMLRKSQIPKADKFPEYLRAIRNEQDHYPPESTFDAIGDDSDRLISFGLFSREVNGKEEKSDKKAKYEVAPDDEFNKEWQDFDNEWQDFEEEWSDFDDNWYPDPSLAYPQQNNMPYNDFAAEDYGNYPYEQSYEEYPVEEFYQGDNYGNDYYPEENYSEGGYPASVTNTGFNQPQLAPEENTSTPNGGNWWLDDNVFEVSKNMSHHYQKEQYNKPKPKAYSNEGIKAKQENQEEQDILMNELFADDDFEIVDAFEEDEKKTTSFSEASKQDRAEDVFTNEDLDELADFFSDYEEIDDIESSSREDVNDEFADAPDLEDFFSDFDEDFEELDDAKNKK
ncbi:MAG: type IV secretory system conjugative DNA transfer family protein [Alphaproteobacteria bacterium]